MPSKPRPSTSARPAQIKGPARGPTPSELSASARPAQVKGPARGPTPSEPPAALDEGEMMAQMGFGSFAPGRFVRKVLLHHSHTHAARASQSSHFRNCLT